MSSKTETNDRRQALIRSVEALGKDASTKDVIAYSDANFGTNLSGRAESTLRSMVGTAKKSAQTEQPKADQRSEVAQKTIDRLALFSNVLEYPNKLEGAAAFVRQCGGFEHALELIEQLRALQV